MWSLLCYCVRARDHCCVLCDVTRDLLFTWYVVYQPLLLFWSTKFVAEWNFFTPPPFFKRTCQICWEYLIHAENPVKFTNIAKFLSEKVKKSNPATFVTAHTHCASRDDDTWREPNGWVLRCTWDWVELHHGIAWSRGALSLLLWTITRLHRSKGQNSSLKTDQLLVFTVPPSKIKSKPCKKWSPESGKFTICTSPIIHLVCPPPQILHTLCFSFLLGITAVPREIENNAFAKFGGANKVHFGRCASGEWKKANKQKPSPRFRSMMDVNSKELYQSAEKEEECCLMFTCSTGSFTS